MNQERVQQARERFGQPFAHEPGATWQPRKVPVLTKWMISKGYECPYCGAEQASKNGTGSDVSCCGEIGHCKEASHA